MYDKGVTEGQCETYTELFWKKLKFHKRLYNNNYDITVHD